MHASDASADCHSGTPWRIADAPPGARIRTPGGAVNPEFLFQALVFMDSGLAASGRAPE
jgi:hypothetical protein